jgi:hypothetical protein
MTNMISAGNRWILRLMALLAVLLAPAASAQYLYQEHYRWRNDDGNETAATWKAAQNTAITVVRGDNLRLRFAEVNKYTGVSGFSAAPRLEYSTSTNGPWTAVSIVSDGLSAFEMTASTYYANQEATTALLTNGTGTFVAGKCVESPDNTGANITINLSQYSNFEYCFKATAKAFGNTAYYFRMRIALSSYPSYTRYAQLAMAAGDANEAPVIKSALTANASVAAAFNYQIQASGSEPVTYGANNLPAGLSFATNRISGTPVSAGTYNIGLTAVNAWGSDSKTLALTVFANQPPVANNQSVSLVEGGEVMIGLSWSDADNIAATSHTFSIVVQPDHGTLQSLNIRNNTTMNPHYWFYRASAGYNGPDVFKWKCRDYENDSNTGIVTVTIRPNTIPVANSGSVTVPEGVKSYTGLSVSDPDAGQTKTYTVVRHPFHGLLTCPTHSASWYYAPDPGYIGNDSFVWKCSDGVDDSNLATNQLTVAPSPPVAVDQSLSVKQSVATMFPALYIGGSGYTCTLSKVLRRMAH